MPPTPVIETRGIVKSFEGVQALRGVNFSVHPGEVHALIGENGAGKSTLMKILAGAIAPDAGIILWNGKEAAFRNPRDAYMEGVRIIYQERNLVPHLTVAENIFLGHTNVFTRRGLLTRALMNRRAKEILDSLEIDVNPTDRVDRLSVAQQQMVEVAKALSIKGRLLIMDEPTSSLSDREVRVLFSAVARLKAEGLGIVFISHRLAEILPISDRVTVLRDGKVVGTTNAKETSIDNLVHMMIGRDLATLYPRGNRVPGDVVLSIRGFTGSKFRDVNFDLRAGEVLGIYGLLGAGRSELARAIVGIDSRASGSINLFGQAVTIRSPRDAFKYGIAFATEDRKRDGLCFNLTVANNIVLAKTRDVTRYGVVAHRLVQEKVQRQVSALAIATFDPYLQLVSQLSGGNQQKVVLARWFGTSPKIFIMDEPTTGIDVGTKAEIYQIISRYVEQGNSVILISSELPEILGMCDRILVMHEGAVVGEFAGADANEEALLQCAMGRFVA